jgi:predicted O-methyltransferase YrrM
MLRYLHLTHLIQRHKPLTIMEVGTQSGGRAIQMFRASGNAAKYIGFDLFELATDDTDKEENNGKKRFSEQQVEARLRESGVDYELVKGNTRTTLPAYQKAHPGAWLDFAFIDGGHSVTTIRSDWAMVKKMMKPGGIVVFDDWYSGDTKGQSGCAPIVEKLDHSILPLSDHMSTGIQINLAMVQI